MLDTPSWKKAILEYREEYNNNPDYPYLSKVFNKTPRELLNFANEKGVYPTSPIEESDIERSVAQDSLEDSFETNSLNLQDYVEDVQEEFLESPDKNTHYSTETHEIFHFKGESLPIAIPKKTWAAIVRDYSDYGPMGRTTVKEIAIKYSIPQKTLERCLRSAGQYHHSAPFTPERIEEEDVEPLSDQALEYKEHQILSKIEAKRYNKAIKENFDLKEQLYNRSKLIEEVSQSFEGLDIPAATTVEKTPTPTSLYLHAPIVDLHIGKFVWSKEDYGNNYDTQIAVDRLREHGNRVVDLIKSRGGRFKEVYLSDLGDLAHSQDSVTDSGTLLHQDTRNKKLWRETLKAKIEQIEAVRPYTDTLYIHCALGNHASLIEWLIQEALLSRYDGVEDVVVSDNLKPQTYFLIGDSLHILDHGKGVGALSAPKAKTQADLVAREIAGDDFYKAKRIYFYVGHLHSLQMDSHGRHMYLYRLESLGESDEYETSLRYVNEPVAHGFVLDDQGRIESDNLIRFH